MSHDILLHGKHNILSLQDKVQRKNKAYNGMSTHVPEDVIKNKQYNTVNCDTIECL